MKFDEEAYRLLDLIVEEWNNAERLIKTAELHCGSVIIPSLQELRYAGRRLMDAFGEFKDDPASELGREYLHDAHFDCLRARHDALDASVSKIASDIDIAIRELGPDVVLRSFPKISELIGLLQIVRDKIEISREERKNRDIIYKSIESEEFEIIFAEYKIFKSSEDLMKSLADKRQRELNSAKTHRNIAYLIGTAGVVLSIVFFFLGQS